MAENKQIVEAYCSYETSKLLKEKGFDLECIARYTKVGDFVEEEYKSNWNFQTTDCSTPTQQMAMRWLRELHGLFILIGNDDLDWNWQIFDIKNRDKNLDPICKSESYGGIDSYEEAVEAAIKYCLENLITE